MRRPIKQNILFFNRKRCTGCQTCEMVCSLIQTGDECNEKDTKIRILTHPYLYTPQALISLSCNCHDGQEKCIELCKEEAIMFQSKDNAPQILRDFDWEPSPIIPGSFEL